jgi:hypothetical protein
MKICASHNQYESYKNKLDEIRYPINMFNQVLNFLNNPQHNQTIVLEIKDLKFLYENSGVKLTQLLKLYEENECIKLCFEKVSDIKQISEATEIRRYMYRYPVNTWNYAVILCKMGVSDLILGEPLVFDMKTVQQLKNDYDVLIRVCPHLGQPQYAVGYTNEINHFFILPHHIKLYENLVDVIEIFEMNILREATLINLYSEKKEYTLPLKLLIENFSKDIPGSFITEDLAKIRMDCRQSCLRPDGICHICDSHTRSLKILKNHSES